MSISENKKMIHFRETIAQQSQEIARLNGIIEFQKKEIKTNRTTMRELNSAIDNLAAQLVLFQDEMNGNIAQKELMLAEYKSRNEQLQKEKDALLVKSERVWPKFFKPKRTIKEVVKKDIVHFVNEEETKEVKEIVSEVVKEIVDEVVKEVVDEVVKEEIGVKEVAVKEEVAGENTQDENTKEVEDGFINITNDPAIQKASWWGLFG